jgi:hypothetical protein
VYSWEEKIKLIDSLGQSGKGSNQIVCTTLRSTFDHDEPPLQQ